MNISGRGRYVKSYFISAIYVLLGAGCPVALYGDAPNINIINYNMICNPETSGGSNCIWGKDPSSNASTKDTDINPPTESNVEPPIPAEQEQIVTFLTNYYGYINNAELSSVKLSWIRPPSVLDTIVRNVEYSRLERLEITNWGQNSAVVTVNTVGKQRNANEECWQLDIALIRVEVEWKIVKMYNHSKIDCITSAPPPLEPPNHDANDIEKTIRDYYDCLGRADVACTVSYWLKPPKTLRRLVSNTEYSQINSGNILSSSLDFAIVEVDVTVRNRGSAEQRWRLNIELNKYQNIWKIKKMYNAVNIKNH